MLPNVKIISEVVQTENYQKVTKAIMTIFPKAKIEISNEETSKTKIIAKMDISELEFFTEMLEKQQILDSARKRARKGLEESYEKEGEYSIKLRFNKQSAFVGKINFLDIDSDHPPLHYFDVFLSNISDVDSFFDKYFPEWKVRREEREKKEKKTKILMKNEEKAKEKLKKVKS